MGFLDNINRKCNKGAVVDVDINGGGDGGGGTVYWSDIVGTPLQFPPTPHTHSISDVIGLDVSLLTLSEDIESKADVSYVDSGLSTKANVNHTHTISEVYNLDAALLSINESLLEKADISFVEDELATKSDVGHTHTISEVTGLQNALNSKLDVSEKGSNNGLAELDSNGKVPSSQLPSYVDDVEEYDTDEDFPIIGESGKIYIARDSNLAYRWSGTNYAEISPSIALGETISTAYRGDRGKIAFDHSQSTGNPHNTQIADIPNLVNNLGSKVDKITGKGLSTNDYSNADKDKLASIGLEWFGTRSEYDALGTYNPTTKYFIEKEA